MLFALELKYFNFFNIFQKLVSLVKNMPIKVGYHIF